MNTSELRASFLDFVGPNTFRKFAHALRPFADDDRRAIRLRFWQEQLWLKFRSRHPSATTEIENILASLLWCDLHGLDLDHLPGVALTDVRKTPELDSYISDRCPFYSGGWAVSCSQCNQELNDWISNHPDDCRILRRRTTLREYIANCPCQEDPRFKSAMRKAELAINGELKDDDEIWEWDAGRGSTGLAIVREGKMRTSWSAPIQW